MNYGIDDYFSHGIERIIPPLITLRLACYDVCLVDVFLNELHDAGNFGEEVCFQPRAVLDDNRGLESSQFYSAEARFFFHEEQKAGIGELAVPDEFQFL